MSARLTPAIRGAAWMLTAQALFAVMSIGPRLIGRAVPWQEVCASRMIVAAVLAFVFAKVRRTSLAVTNLKYAWLRSIFGTLAAAGTFYVLAAPGLALGDAVTLFAVSPIFVAILSWPLLGERVRASVAIGMVFAFAGVVFVARPSFQTAPWVVSIGALTALGSALAMMWLRKIGPGESPEAIVFHFMCVGSVAMVLASIPVWKMPDTRSLVFMATTGLSGGLAQLALTRAYSSDNAARVSVMGYSNIVFVRALALPVFGELPSLAQIAGSLLVIGSGVLLGLRGWAEDAKAIARSDAASRSTS